MFDRRLASLLTACVLLALVLLPRVGGWGAPLLARSPNVAAGPAADAVEVGGCRTGITRTLSASEIRECEQVTVTTHVTSACRGCPGGINIVFILNSGSQSGTAQIAASMIDELERLHKASDTKVAAAVVYYWPRGARLAAPLSENLARARGAFAGPPNWRGWGGFEPGAEAGLRALRGAGGTKGARCDIILFTGRLKEHDGAEWEVYRQELRRAVGMMRPDDSTLMAYCSSGAGDVNCATMRQVAESPQYYAEYPDTQKLPRAARTRIRELLDRSPAGLRSLGLNQGLPAGVAYVKDSATPPLGEIVSGTITTTLRWLWDGPMDQADYTTTYRIAPTAPGGLWPIAGLVDVMPRSGERHQVPMTPVAVNVTGPCAPSPTASPMPTPTATPVPSPTASATANPVTPATLTPSATQSATSTATPTVTPRPRPAYLPVALRERCVPGQKRIDVALVIDASTSMRDDVTSAGRTKLSAAIDAAMAFVATLALPQDQAAVVVFNDDAQVVQDLTGRRSAIEAALAQIPRLVRQHTRIDRGIEEAHGELGSARHNPVNQAVMIVLTDGLANPEPASTAVRRAQAAKDAGITIFTIGLGNELDDWALEAIASKPSYFYRTPDGEDLLAIYRTIAVEIPCPAERYWGRR